MSSPTQKSRVRWEPLGSSDFLQVLDPNPKNPPLGWIDFNGVPQGSLATGPPGPQGPAGAPGPAGAAAGYPLTLPVTGGKYIGVNQQITGTGSVDIYTVPANKRAIFLYLTVMNSSGANLFPTPQVKISGTYYNLNSAPLVVNTGSNLSTPVPYFAEAGEVLAINAAGQPYQVYGIIYEFDNTSPVGSSKIVPSVGNNTVFTCPPGKTAVLGSPIPSLPNGVTNNQSVFFSQFSGATRTYGVYLVPNGGSPGPTNIIVKLTATISQNAAGIVNSAVLSAGDSIVFADDAATPTQLVWANWALN